MLKTVNSAKKNLTRLLSEDEKNAKAILLALHELEGITPEITEDIIVRSGIASVLCAVRKEFSKDKNSAVLLAVKRVIAAFKKMCTASDDYNALAGKQRKIVDAFIQVLSMSTSDLPLAQRLACRIEDALSDELDDEGQYKKQVRSLIHNLKVSG